MKVAALYDVHGNLPALEAVMADPRLADADVIVSGGDLVIPGRFRPSASTCSRRTDASASSPATATGRSCAPTRTASLVESAGWSAARLTADRLARVERWPSTVELEVAGLGAVLFCHATPTSDLSILTRRDARGGRWPASSATSPPTWSSAATHMSSTTAAWVGQGS